MLRDEESKKEQRRDIRRIAGIPKALFPELMTRGTWTVNCSVVACKSKCKLVTAYEDLPPGWIRSHPFTKLPACPVHAVWDGPMIEAAMELFAAANCGN